MEFRFNLIDEPWLPIVSTDSSKQEKNLLEILLDSHRISYLDIGYPHMNAAILRLLLAILYRSFTMKNVDDWQELWERKRFDPVPLRNYLEKWRERFDLFHESFPFYQNQHPEVSKKPANELLYQIAGGNHETLFNHDVEDRPISLSPKQAAQMLITAQAFSLGGLCNPSLKLTYTDAPSSRGMVFFLQGENLFESLMLNLVPYNETAPIKWKRGAEDLPAWEMENPYEPDRIAPNGYLDYLTWQNRKIMLFPRSDAGITVVDRITSAPGLRMTDDQVNPMYLYRIDSKQTAKQSPYKVARFTEGKALWRDSSAIFGAEEGKARHPKSFVWAENLIGDGVIPKRRLSVAAFGMSTEPGKQKVNFYRGEQFFFPDQLMVDGDLANKLQEALDLAELYRKQLWGAASRFAGLILSPDMDLKGGRNPDSKDVGKLIDYWNPERTFWGVLEIAFYQFLDALADHPEEALTRWKGDLKSAGKKAFDRIVSLNGSDARALKAGVKARVQFFAGIKKINGQANEE